MIKASSSYFQTQMTTTSQGDILIMLYDASIKFLQQAKERITARDPAGKGILISKALDVINELDCTLNVEKGGDLAQNLHELYYYCSTRLLVANLKMDNKIVDEVLNVLTGLRSAYAEIKNRPEAIAAAQEAAEKLNSEGSVTPRAQAGTSTTGTAAAPVTPGAAMRRQQLYSRQLADAAPKVAPVETAPQQAVIPQLSQQARPQAAPQYAKAAIQPPVAAAQQEVRQQVQAAPSTTPEPIEETAPQAAPDPVGLVPPTAGFGGKFGARGLGGVNMYKKFAANQQ